MAASFEVRGTSILEDRKLFAVKGVLASGMARTGMRAELGDADAGDAFSEPVHGVEHLEAGDGEGESALAVLFYYSRREKLEAWRALDWDGRTLTLHW